MSIDNVEVDDEVVRARFNAIFSFLILSLGCVLVGIALKSVLVGVGLFLIAFSVIGFLANMLS